MTDYKHTPVPWAYEGTTVYKLNADGVNQFQAQVSPGFLKYPPRDKPVKTSDDEVKATAEFIARACNSHYELLEALERMVDDVPFGDEPEYALAALAKARGETK